MTDKAELQRVFGLQQAQQWDVKASTAAERKAKLVDTFAAKLGDEHGKVRLHFYPLGGMVKTAEWIRDYERRR